MRLLGKVLLILLLDVTALCAQNAPVVTNVDFNMRNDGSKIVDIIYDVNDADGDTMTISIEASSDGGTTWGLSITQVTGAVDGGITSGTGKTIVWYAGNEHPNFYSPTVQIRITAFDVNIPFNCGTQITYAGKTYNTVQVGSKCWLKENLDVGTMIQDNVNQKNNGTIEKYCYNNITANCTTYGGLYQLNEAMAYSTTPSTKGICPTGWHIPTEAEFSLLGAAVSHDGNALKAEGQGTQSGAGTNTSGFSALLAGYRGYTGNFASLGDDTHFWSSTEYSATYVYAMYLWGGSSNINLTGYHKDNGYSVRCIMD